MRCPSALALALVVAGATAVLSSSTSEAGDIRLTTLWVNMTPDASSSAAAKACVGELEAKVKADYTEHTKLGESALRTKVGKTAGEPFLSWPAATMVDVMRPGGLVERGIDVAFLVDCRPESQQLDIWIVPAAPYTTPTGPTRAIATIQLRHVAIDRTITDWVGTAMMRRAWGGASIGGWQ